MARAWLSAAVVATSADASPARPKSAGQERVSGLRRPSGGSARRQPLPNSSPLWARRLDKRDSVGAGLRGKLSQHLEGIDINLEHFTGPARRDVATRPLGRAGQSAAAGVVAEGDRCDHLAPGPIYDPQVVAVRHEYSSPVRRERNPTRLRQPWHPGDDLPVRDVDDRHAAPDTLPPDRTPYFPAV